VLDTPQPSRLVCAECRRESDEHARKWRALVLSDDDAHPPEDDFVAVFCSVCWAREFAEPAS
jgi:hypothetical protein